MNCHNFVLLLIAGGWGWRSNTTLAEERAMRIYLQNEFAQQEVIFELVDSQETQRVYVPPVDDGSNSYGKVYTRPDRTGIVFVGGHLPQPPDGYGYHVYLTNNDNRYLAGVLDVNQEGFGVLLVDTESWIPEYEQVDFALQSLAAAGAEEPVLQWKSPDGH